MQQKQNGKNEEEVAMDRRTAGGKEETRIGNEDLGWKWGWGQGWAGKEKLVEGERRLVWGGQKQLCWYHSSCQIILHCLQQQQQHMLPSIGITCKQREERLNHQYAAYKRKCECGVVGQLLACKVAHVNNNSEGGKTKSLRSLGRRVQFFNG